MTVAAAHSTGTEIGQILLVIGAALVLMGLAYTLTRRRLLAVRYGLGWLVVSLLIMLAAPLLILVEPVANFIGISPTGLLLFAIVGCLVLIVMQLSVSISGLQRAIRDLSEAHAIDDEQKAAKIASLEQRLDAPSEMSATQAKTDVDQEPERA